MDDKIEYTTGETLRETFRRVGEALEYQAAAYLIGGGAMTLRGTKDSTKDIDLVTRDRESFRRIEAALLDLGFTQETERAELVSRVAEENPCRETLVETAIDRLAKKGVVEVVDTVCRPGWTELE